MKKTICLLMIFCFVFILLGCNKSADEIKVSYDLKTEPQNLDPQTASDSASLLIIYNTFEGLMKLDENGKAVPAAAASYNISADNKLYTFTLINNLKWENNTAITAHDFAFAFERLLSKDTNSPNAKKFYSIKNAQSFHEGNSVELGVYVTNDTTLEIALESPNPDFLSLLTTTGAMPCNESFFKETFGKYGLEPETILTNGAFHVSKWQHDEYVSLKKNINFHKSEDVHVSGVSLWIDTDKIVNDKPEYYNPADRLVDKKVLCADVDGFDMDKIDLDDFNAVESENSTYALVFNQNNPKLKSVNLRLAIASAFDRSSYKDALHSSLSVANALIPSSIMSGTSSFRQKAGTQLSPEFNALKAFEFYTDATAELNVTAVVNLKMIAPVSEKNQTSNYFPFPSQILQKVLGIFIGIVEDENYSMLLKSGDFDIALVKLYSTDGTGYSVLSQFHSRNNNYGINYPALDAALDDAQTITDPILSDERLADAEKIILDNAIAIPIFYKTDYFVTNKTVANFARNQFNGMIDFSQIVFS